MEPFHFLFKCVTDVTKKDTYKILSTLFQISPQTFDRGTLVEILIERVCTSTKSHTPFQVKSDMLTCHHETDVNVRD